MEESIGVEKIWQQDGRTLAIKWTDGKENLFDVVELRRRCPCANCIDEWTKKPKLKPEDVDDSLRPVKIASVGRYALSIAFSDGHATGIYTYKSLREF
jgi:DUF971 family protein